MNREELTAAEKAAEEVITDSMPHLVGIVADALARLIVAKVRPIIEAEMDAKMGDGSEHLYPVPEENFWDDRTMTGEGS